MYRAHGDNMTADGVNVSSLVEGPSNRLTKMPSASDSE
jgi:hypothetical protein